MTSPASRPLHRAERPLPSGSPGEGAPGSVPTRAAGLVRADTTLARRCLLAGLLAAAPLAAAEFDFYAAGPYREEAPRPDEFLGYEPGTLHTHHFRMEAYLRALAAALPERVEIREYGESYEKKRLLLVVISSEENLVRIEELRRRNLALADPRRTGDAEAAAIASEAPVVVWLDYGNDGNETANVEAAMLVAFQLAAGEGEEMARLRRESVVLIEPDHNPESHDRHVAWYNAFAVGDPDPLAMEHHAPWGMSTNNNHYQIDLNRDAWALTQRENQAIAVEILGWRPQVFVDHHGQTENYFFAPPVAPVNPSLPASHHRWHELFGRGNAAAFDRHGWQYYVRDVFDLFYPGYWDSWPSLHGAIGMTYETDGGGHRGLAWRKRDGSIVTFRDGIAKHFVASLATVRTAVENRRELLADFRAFFSTAIERGRRGVPARAFALDAVRDPRRSAALVAALLRHGIEVRRAEAPFTAAAAPLVGGPAAPTDFAAGTYLVDMAQPDQRAAETFLALEAPLPAEFVQAQLDRWSRNARRGERATEERYEFYDLTSWSLPVAYGVDAYTLSALPPAAGRLVVAPADGLAGSGDWDDEIPFALGDHRVGVGARIGGLDGVAERPGPGPFRAGSAYLFRPEAEGAAHLLAALLVEGYRVAVSVLPLEAGAQAFPRGTFVVRVERNPESLHERIDALARRAGVEVVASDTAFAASGPTGIGSNAVIGLKAPKIAMLADDGLRITGYGAAWFTLERRLHYPFTPIRFAQLRRANLDRLDVLVLPQGRTGAYRRGLGDEGLERLQGWIEGGGTVVAWGSGPARWLMDAELVGSSFAGFGDDDGDEEVTGRLSEIDRLVAEETPRQPVASPSADPDRPQPIPGAVLRARLDLTHWLTLGYDGEELPVLVRGQRFPTLSEKGENPVVFDPAGDLHLSGFVWPGNSERWLARTAWAVVEPRGRGQVILFAQDPNFRLVWRSTSRLFANALLLGPSLGARRPEGL